MTSPQLPDDCLVKLGDDCPVVEAAGSSIISKKLIAAISALLISIAGALSYACAGGANATDCTVTKEQLKESQAAQDILTLEKLNRLGSDVSEIKVDLKTLTTTVNKMVGRMEGQQP